MLYSYRLWNRIFFFKKKGIYSISLPSPVERYLVSQRFDLSMKLGKIFSCFEVSVIRQVVVRCTNYSCMLKNLQPYNFV